MKQAFFYETPLGKIGLAEESGAITNLFFGATVVPSSYETTETPLLREAARQLAEYFAGSRREFQLPMALAGTPFQQEIWKGLLTIPYGETRTYGELARQLERPKAARAVGFANRQNPISILVPCHRVIGANGGLTGYAGGLEAKKFLLALEGIL